MDLQHQLINWYKKRHPAIAQSIDNSPQQQETTLAHNQLIETLLKPIEKQFGEITITYGFTNFALKNFIQKHSPNQTAPTLDQHAACELNSRGKPICPRLDAACDIRVKGYEQRMDIIAKYIAATLPYDRMYFYSPSNALHVSVGPEHSRMVQQMKRSDKGNFLPFKRASNEKAVYLY